jgi:hypothetical protein
MAAKHCTASRDGKMLLSCWVCLELRMELDLDRVWAGQGLKPHGRTRKGLRAGQAGGSRR